MNFGEGQIPWWEPRYLDRQQLFSYKQCHEDLINKILQEEAKHFAFEKIRKKMRQAGYRDEDYEITHIQLGKNREVVSYGVDYYSGVYNK